MGPFEDVITLGVNAAMPMLTAADRDAIRLLIVATESSPDQEKPVSSWVHHFLGLRSDCRNFEVKHACYGATGALQVAIGWLMSAVDPGAKVLIINADHALIGLDGPQEPVLGAAGLALLLSNNPRIVEFDAGWNGVYAHEVADIFRPAPGSRPAMPTRACCRISTRWSSPTTRMSRASGRPSTSIDSSPPTCITCRSAASPSARTFASRDVRWACRRPRPSGTGTGSPSRRSPTTAAPAASTARPLLSRWPGSSTPRRRWPPAIASASTATDRDRAPSSTARRLARRRASAVAEARIDQQLVEPARPHRRGIRSLRARGLRGDLRARLYAAGRSDPVAVRLALRRPEQARLPWHARLLPGVRVELTPGGHRATADRSRCAHRWRALTRDLRSRARVAGADRGARSAPTPTPFASASPWDPACRAPRRPTRSRTC